MVEQNQSLISGNDDNELTFHSIIMLQIKKICDIGSQDMYGGYTVQKSRQVGEIMVEEDEYTINLKEAFCNAVLILQSLTYHKYNPIYVKLKSHEVENAKKLNKLIEKWKETIESSFRQYHNDNNTQEQWYDEKVRLHRLLFAELVAFLQVGSENKIGG